MSPRALDVLDINDEVKLDPAKYLHFINYTRIDRAVSAQVQLSRGYDGADLFLVDVQMGTRDIPSGLEWGSKEYRPFGPLLALPFLRARPVTAFAPYSAYWDAEEVRKNGFMLLALSFILSHTSKRACTLTDAVTYVESTSGGRAQGLALEGEIALKQALRQYRAHLSQEVTFADLRLTAERLADLEQSADSDALELPLRDAEGLIGVEFFVPSTSKAPVSIQVASLFGDMFDFRPPNASALRPVINTLRAWADGLEKMDPPRSIARRGETLFNSVINALRKCESGVPVNKVAEETEFVMQGGPRHQLIRLAMLFAWVNAWRDGEPEKRVEHVHAQLGLRDPGTSRMAEYAAIRYNRFLGLAGPGGIRVGAPPWRGPFKVTYEGTADAYKLDKDKPGTLSPFEKSMCTQYAIDVVDWDPEGDDSETPYPAWMR